jgi:hypothetical protein
MANNANSLRSDWAAYKIQQAEKWGHSDMVVAQGLADTAEALALVNALAAEIGNQKLADIAKTVAQINAQRAAEGIRCRRKVTENQRYALATALLEKHGSPRAIVKAGWAMTDEEIDSAEA